MRWVLAISTLKITLVTLFGNALVTSHKHCERTNPIETESLAKRPLLFDIDCVVFELRIRHSVLGSGGCVWALRMCCKSGRSTIFTESRRKNQQESEVTRLLCKVVRALRAMFNIWYDIAKWDQSRDVGKLWKVIFHKLQSC